MYYFDNAATTFPKPKQVINAVQSALLTYSANPGRSGHKLSQNASIEIYNARKKAAALFNAPREENVIFTPNCTASLNYAIKGSLKTNDKVLVSSLEHNAVMRPLHALKANDIKANVFEVIIGDKEATFRSFVNTVTRDTKMVICTHASNVTGSILPIEQIGAYCREYGIIFVVDAAQSAGVLDIDVQKMCIDYLCIASHKGLYAPMGTGILIIGGDFLRDTIIEGGTGTDSINMQQPKDMPERYESGTVNLPGIVGISAGIDFVRQKGIDKIRTHESELIKYIYNGFNRISRVRLYTEPDPDQYVPVLPFNVANINSVEIANRLNDADIAVRAGLHCAPNAHRRLGTLEQGAIRVCPSVFNTKQDADKLLNAVELLANKVKGVTL